MTNDTQVTKPQLGSHPFDKDYTAINGSYSVAGTVYSAYTNQPSKLITIAEAADLAQVTPRTMRKWLKQPLSPRKLDFTSGVMLIDYEVQYWLEHVVNKTYPKRTWTRALDYLRKLTLIDKTSVLQKLQERHDREWSPVARKVNKFDDSHVAAYRRGIKDAMAIVRHHGVECWDYVPKIGQAVWVGGCTGAITKIYDGKIIVSGVYVGYAGEDKNGKELPPDRESWSFTYDHQTVIDADIRPWLSNSALRNHKNAIIWDYEHVTRISGY